MKTITLNDNHIAHLNAKNTTKLEYLNLSNNNLLPTNDIDQLISSKHLWHVLVNGINNDPLAQMQYWTAVRNIIDDTNEVTIDLSGLNLTTQPPGLQNFTSINLDNNQLTHFDATNYDRLVKLSLNSNTLESINFPQGRNVSITHISMNNNALRNIDIDRLSSVTYFSAAHNQLEFVHGLAILSPGAFEVHSDGIDVDNELFHYPIKKAYTPYNIHTYKTEEVVNQRNIKVKNMTLDEINNTYCNNDYYNQAIREEPIDLLDRSFSSSSWPF